MRKKIVAALIGLIACIVCICTFGGCRWCYERGGQGICFSLMENDEYCVIGLEWAKTSDIVIPSTFERKPVTHIYVDNEDFSDWCEITSIVIPESITIIYGNPFAGCDRLEKITVSENNPVYHSAGNCLIETESKTLIGGCKNSVIPDDESVIAIGERAFTGLNSLEEIVIPDSIGKIEDSGFYECHGLKSITLSSGIKEIGYGAFSYCENLVDVTIASGSIVIGDGAFMCCRSLVSIVIPDGVILGSSLFVDCDSLTVYCEAESEPDSWDDDWNNNWNPVVWNCKNNDVAKDRHIYTVIDGIRYALKDGVAAVERQPVNLDGEKVIPQTVSYKGKSYDVKYINEKAFFECGKLTVITLCGVTSIGKNAFIYCSSLTNIIILDGIKEVCEDAFYGCDSLQYNEYDNGLYLGNEDNKYLVFIKSNNKDITTCTINDNTKVIADYGFYEHKNLTSVTIGKRVTEIGTCAFNRCSSLISVTIPGGVSSISLDAFGECSSLTSVTILDGVTSIDGGAFERCSSLTSITIPKSVTYIGGRAFEECTSLTRITIPDEVTFIGWSAFRSCSSLTSVTLPDGLMSIGDHAFNRCSELKEIVIPGSVTSIGEFAFGKCSNLTIYCEAESKPQDFDDEWNVLEKKANPVEYCKVIWDYKKEK